MIRRRCRLVLLALALAAAGCSDSPQVALFTLVPRPGVQIDRPVGSVAVRLVEVAKYLDRPQIVRHRSEYELATSDFERWGESLDQMVTRVLVEDLSLRLPASRITVAQSPVTVQADATLALDIARFDPDPDGTVVLVVRWTIRRTGRTGTIQIERITLPTSSRRAIDLAAAMSDCLGELSDRLAPALAAAGG